MPASRKTCVLLSLTLILFTQICLSGIPVKASFQYSYLLPSDKALQQQQKSFLPNTVQSGSLLVSESRIHKSVFISRLIRKTEETLAEYDALPPGNSQHLEIGEALKSYVLQSRKESNDHLPPDDKTTKFLDLLDRLADTITATPKKIKPPESPELGEDGIIVRPCGALSEPPFGAMAMPTCGYMDDLALTGGGAQDNRHFNQLVEAGQIPEPSQFSAKGCFSTFDLRLDKQACDDVAYVTPGLAFDTRTEHLYLQMSLDTSISGKTFQRKALNLCIVLDISRSMDRKDGTGLSRLDWAKMAICMAVRNMNSDDRLSVALFDDDVEILLEPQPVENQNEIMELIALLVTRRATNLNKGLTKGFELVKSHFDPDCENRVLMLTDANANVGEIKTGPNKNLVQNYALQDIGLTVLGIGDSFKDDLIKAISKSRGGNYIFVQSR